MEFMVLPRISQHGMAYDSPFYEKYYVFALVKDPEHPLGAQAIYLHANGEWRRTVLDENGGHPGYFDTEADAQASLDADSVTMKAA